MYWSEQENIYEMYSKFVFLFESKHTLPTVVWWPLTKEHCNVFKHAWFQASTVKQMGTALLWVTTQRVAAISYRRFGTYYRSHLQGSRFLTLVSWFFYHFVNFFYFWWIVCSLLFWIYFLIFSCRTFLLRYFFGCDLISYGLVLLSLWIWLEILFFQSGYFP